MNFERPQLRPTLLTMILAATLVVTGLVVVDARPAAAQECELREDIDDDGGQGDVLCSDDHPGRPPATTDYWAVWDTFTQSSAGHPGDAFSGEATVTWIFSWAVNGAPQGDFGEPFFATTTFDIQVGEIQAIES